MIRIRTMTMEDLPQALAVEQACFSEPWSEDVYRAALLLPFNHYLAAVDVHEDGSEQVIGTIGVRAVAGEGEIVNVAVLPAYRCRGIAHRLLSEALCVGRENGVGDFTLEVRESSHAARAVYEDAGFVTEGRRPDFYTRPREAALIMWLRGDRKEPYDL